MLKGAIVEKASDMHCTCRWKSIELKPYVRDSAQAFCGYKPPPNKRVLPDMAALNAQNLEKLNRQDGSVKSSRRHSIISRKSSLSHSTTGDGASGPVSNRWRRLSRAFSTSIGNPNFRVATVRSTDTPAAASKPLVRFENTFKMAPDPGTRFVPGEVEKIARQVLEANLTEKTRYEPRTCAIFTQRIAEEIKMRVKELKIPRYKIACQVFMGSVSGQCQRMVSRAVWNTDTDNFATWTYQNNSLYAVALVHCTYYE
ncbi:tctex1 domain-containing protein 1-B-like isoform X2 [Acanthaster planci]|uniref:Tctex1 domain-containing protein 1-B-like isoform X2 n=1 Tax=Acanthaster planci TaxID=133434 RepID=A0A8B7ZEV3_ACAPL|nr:tctex1 domain-containing protein 1-B-like isoform X2 [Acanthaster planci]